MANLDWWTNVQPDLPSAQAHPQLDAAPRTFQTEAPAGSINTAPSSLFSIVGVVLVYSFHPRSGKLSWPQKLLCHCAPGICCPPQPQRSGVPPFRGAPALTFDLYLAQESHCPSDRGFLFLDRPEAQSGCRTLALFSPSSALLRYPVTLKGKVDMEDGNAAPSHPWRLIAQELSKETNPKRVAELAHELNAALDQQIGEFPDSHEGTN